MRRCWVTVVTVLRGTKCWFLGRFRTSATRAFYFLFSGCTQIPNVVSKDIFEVLLLFLFSLFTHVFRVLFRSDDLHCRLRKNKYFHKDHLYIFLLLEPQFIPYSTLKQNQFECVAWPLLHKLKFSFEALFSHLEFSSRPICLKLLNKKSWNSL